MIERMFHKDGHYCIGNAICNRCNRDILFGGNIRGNYNTPCKLCIIELGLVDQLYSRPCFVCKEEAIFHTITAWEPYPLSEAVTNEETEGKYYSGKSLDDLMKDNPYQVYCETCTRALIQQAREGNATIYEFVGVLEALALSDGA